MQLKGKFNVIIDTSASPVTQLLRAGVVLLFILRYIVYLLKVKLGRLTVKNTGDLSHLNNHGSFYTFRVCLPSHPHDVMTCGEKSYDSFQLCKYT